jgi:beta-galactosidase
MMTRTKVSRTSGAALVVCLGLFLLRCGSTNESPADGGVTDGSSPGRDGTAPDRTGPSSSGSATTGGSSGGKSSGGSTGSSTSAGTTGSGTSAAASVNEYDGARPTTVNFDASWRFHLGDLTGAQATTFDDSSWTALDVPHDWSISLPFDQNSAGGAGGGYLDGGIGWYRKTFALPSSSQGQRVFVQFDGAYMDSTVWVNGTQICARPYGFVSYECDFTSAATFGGSNVLAVRLNNQLPSSRWYSGSGIYRHVWLKTVNPVRVAYTGTRVTTPTITTMNATVAVTVTVQNDGPSAQSVTVSSSVLDASGTPVAQATGPAAFVANGSTSDVTQTLSVANPRLWSLASPNMYSLVTSVMVNGFAVDTYTTPFGIRSFAFDPNTGFSLNGQSVKLNGVCNHHDLGSLGAAINNRAIQKRLEMLKMMGVNALRTSHNPPAPELLAMADTMGFLVMDEAFDTWDQAKVRFDYARFFSQWSTTDISAMVDRDRNHPSVIIWSIGNEIADPGNHTAAQSLISAVKKQDASRVIGQAFLFATPDPGTAAMEDVVGLNYSPGSYDGLHSSNPTWKFFASESSSAVRSRGIYKLPVTQNILTSNDTQCSSYDNSVVSWGNSAESSWQAVSSRGYIAGEFVWTGFDYIGEPTPYSWPAKSSYFGAIDTAGFPKDAFYFYQSRWNFGGPTMVHITPMDWTSWTAGQSVPVFVYSNADSVELFLNGVSVGSRTVDPDPSHPNSGHVQWTVPFATGTLQARATKNGVVVVSDTVQTAGAPSAVTLTTDRASITADGSDLAYVEADIVDSKGGLVPQASNTIDFSVSGGGTIVGVDNGNPISHESYQGTSRSAFSGKALAIVRSTTTPGKITLRATSGSLTGGSVDITSAPIP